MDPGIGYSAQTVRDRGFQEKSKVVQRGRIRGISRFPDVPEPPIRNRATNSPGKRNIGKMGRDIEFRLKSKVVEWGPIDSISWFAEGNRVAKGHISPPQELDFWSGL